ncbi:MAG TPA: response regulator transcription factor [Rhodocyclaceae bacterium]|jgi:DNA-binding NarL/FixJ family response regulator|nr:response regulator transcription factor [Rhodocyclaceae bacterium]HMW78197.1 response regulator transcription factor [Rhodocyclaceae bacterium]HNE41922.1 response regulator transcription factor [Rhodocyclaceae bacterium]HNM21491.1 response regulator transcription factor [Rhodocyclaceae bacterium]HNM79838.1 response regulator transcription factor [Rhodocyclaceae bacterium]
MKPIRILVADDHNLIRAGILRLLSEVSDFEVVADTADGAQAVALADRLTPDVALLDIAMPGTTGLQAMEQILAAHPATRVLILTMYDTEEHVISAMRLGAAGYVLKNAAPQEMELAIRAVIAGGTWLPAAISRPVVEAYLERVQISDTRDGLTPRQREVLKMIAEGLRTKEIAFSLGVSIKTIETYRAQIMNRLGIGDVPGLVRYAIRRGLSQL